ncbi:saccharopine dehydrogenase family protein [Qipengyuania sp. DGS5-3]|uniref:saccharopine dehydrogenase family protein n=1 Tax=Qipengyuania sp. DGS5-3 TaxID=3349632 RepID=UPI0036D3EC5F
MGATVLVLGGAGAMGRHLCQALVGMDSIGHIRVAGIDDQAGLEFCKHLGGKAEYRSLDVTDEDHLLRALGEVDVVANATGPFYKLAGPILRAAIASGTHYVDICDDVEPTRSMLALHEKAQRAGITAIIGMGASPGLTNLLARIAVERLETTTSLVTTWDLQMTVTVDDGFAAPWDAAQTPAAIVHWMHCCSGDVPVTQNGRTVVVRPLEPTALHFLGGRSVTGWSVAHPEPVTLAAAYPELHECANFMTGRSGIFELLRPIRDRIDGGTLTIEGAADLLVSEYRLGEPITLEAEADRRRSRESKAPAVGAIATGLIEGTPATVVAEIDDLPPGGMGASTGIPAAIALRLIADGAITRRGVFAPEDIISPESFFECFATFCDSSSSDLVRVEVGLE